VVDRRVLKEVLTPAQVRAARGWLNWSQEDLSAKSGVSQKSIARYEREHCVAYANTLAKLRGAFESAGVRFEFDGMAARGIRRE
jgi:transcriptional regulator with XRE-family HTH domain